MRDLAAINGFVVFMSLIAFAAAWFFSGVIEIGVQFAAGCLAGWAFILMAIVARDASEHLEML